MFMWISLRDERQITRQVAAKMSGQQTGLQMRQQAERSFRLKQGVRDLFQLSVMIGGQHDFATFRSEQDTLAGTILELFRLYLPSVDEREYQPIRKKGTELLHQI